MLCWSILRMHDLLDQGRIAQIRRTISDVGPRPPLAEQSARWLKVLIGNGLLRPEPILGPPWIRRSGHIYAKRLRPDVGFICDTMSHILETRESTRCSYL